VLFHLGQKLTFKSKKHFSQGVKVITVARQKKKKKRKLRRHMTKGSPWEGGGAAVISGPGSQKTMTEHHADKNRWWCQGIALDYIQSKTTSRENCMLEAIRIKGRVPSTIEKNGLEVRSYYSFQENTRVYGRLKLLKGI